MALCRWSAAGLAAAAPIGLVDVAVTLPGPEGTHAAGVAALTLALHLTTGLFAGGALGVVSLLLGGLTLDRAVQRLREAFDPLRAHRSRRAASFLAAPVFGGGAAAILFLVNLRFMAFNNPALASLLLVVVTAVVLGVVLAAYVAVRGRLEGLARRMGERWPGKGDAPLLWLAPSAGLMAGAVGGAAIARWEAVAENVEALDPAPLVGVGVLLLVTAVVEVVSRRRLPRASLAVGGLLFVASGGAWWAALGGAVFDGGDNAVVHEASVATRLYLTMAERATDRDKDGFSPLFAHGDCDDTDADAWPGSPDGDDCAPDVELEDRAAFEARLHGAEPVEPPLLPPVISPTPEPLSPAPQIGGPVPMPEPPRRPTLARPFNVVLVTIDTLRADHVGWLGYERPTTPNLDKLASASLIYERAYSTSNLTPAAIPSIMSGLYPTELYRDDSHFIHFDERNTFVAEMLSGAGYETRAIVTHWYFEKKTKSGLDQGFSDWTVVGTKWGKQMEDVSTSELVSAEALRQLPELPEDRPWFLWLHFLDPHKWYVTHPGFDVRFGNRPKDRYDHEVAFVDHELGKVLAAIARHPAAERTAIFVTSDHGEAFGEHNTGFHGFSIYEDQLRVPLIVHIPGLDPRRFRRRVSLIDVVPTMLDLAALRSPHRLQGRSWVPDADGPSPSAAEPAQRLIYAERPRGPFSAGYRALIDGDMKLVWRAAGNRYELYNLAVDPQEATDLYRANPEAAERLTSAMSSMQRLALDNKGRVTAGRRAD